MKIIITESQNESLKNNLMKVINRSGFDVAIKSVGSFNRLVKILGKETLYSILTQHGFDPVNNIEIIQSQFDVPEVFLGDRFISRVGVNELLNNYGPMFLFILDNNHYLYQNQNKQNLFVGKHDGVIPEESFQYHILYPLGLKGLDIGKVIDLYYTDEN
jgi:hypothetical protein